MSDCSRSVFLLRCSVTITARTFFVFRLYRPRLVSICCLKNVSVGCFKRYICFVCPKLSSAFGLSPYENQYLVVGDVGGLYVIVYGWCWSITLSFPLFSHMFHYSSECITLVWRPLCLFSKSEGGFSCPWVLTAREISANEVVSLLVWSRHLQSRWLRLLMLPPSVTVFHLHNLLCKYLSLHALSFYVC